MVYDEWLRSLPIPTPEQTARFADHVANNHSWYKHLPFFPPGAGFVLFPNLHAGRVVSAVGDRFEVNHIAEGDYFRHHSRLATKEYLDQFGHWDYTVIDNPRSIDPQPGPWLYSVDGCHRDLLADDLTQAWSCRLTAFLKPALPMFDLRVSELHRESDAFLVAHRHSWGQFVRGMFSRKRDEVPVSERYRKMAARLRRAPGSAWSDPAVSAFMESESRAQREILVNTLDRVRATWSGWRWSPSARSGGDSR